VCARACVLSFNFDLMGWLWTRNEDRCLLCARAYVKNPYRRSSRVTNCHYISVVFVFQRTERRRRRRRRLCVFSFLSSLYSKWVYPVYVTSRCLSRRLSGSNCRSIFISKVLFLENDPLSPTHTHTHTNAHIQKTEFGRIKFYSRRETSRKVVVE